MERSSILQIPMHSFLRGCQSLWMGAHLEPMCIDTLKFKTANKIGSNPVLSELIRYFELQRPVQRCLTPKWHLSWVLDCLQKTPYEHLHKASKLHVTIKTAFLLALATAKRYSEIHDLAMNANHFKFNQLDGSVSLIVQSWFWQRFNFSPFAQIL